MKVILQVILFSGLVLPMAPQAVAQKNWSLGIRAGLMTNINPNQDGLYVETGGFHSAEGVLFVQRSLGKRQQWLIELAGTYYKSKFPSVLLPGLMRFTNAYEEIFANHVVNFRLSGHYLVFKHDRINWKHYAGVFGEAREIISQYRYAFEQDGGPLQGFSRGAFSYFAGFSYLGKIELSSKINVQYQLGYAHEIPFFYNLKAADAPYAHQLFVNAGIGYTF